MVAEVGVCTAGGWLTQSDDKLKQDLDGIADTGFKWVRWPWDWTSIETRQGQYNLDRRRDISNWMKDRGLHPYPVLGYTPSFYRDPALVQFGARAPCPVSRYPAWRNYVRACFNLAKPLGIKVFGHWNESNHMPFWAYPSPDKQAALLRITREEARRADPLNRIVLGEFSPAPTVTAPGGKYREINPVVYARLWYQKGYRNLVDMWGIHPYFDGEPETRASHSLMTVQYDAFRRVLTDNGHGAIKIWGTEMGHTTQPNDAGGRTRRSEAEQARLIVKQLDIWRRRSTAGVGFLFAWQEFVTPEGPVNGLGIVRMNGSYKPARAAVRELLT